MSILNFDDQKKPKRIKAILGLGAVALSISLGSTLAANVNLNSGAPVEFGQGVAMTTACDDEVFVTPNSEFVNSANNPGFEFTSFAVTEISDACDGKVFTIRAFKNGQSAPLNLYNVNAGDSFDKVEVLRSQGNYSSIGEGSFPEGISSPTQDSFIITFATSVDGLTTVPVALAQDVDRMTIESRDATDEDSAPDPGPQTFTFTFNYACDGACTSDNSNSSTRTFTSGDQLVDFPSLFLTYENQQFAGWLWTQDPMEDGYPIDQEVLKAMTWTANATFTALWTYYDSGPP